MLAQLGLVFDVVCAEVTEHEDPSTNPDHMVAHNAALKADWVAERHPHACVLGADTTVFLDGHALNKPADPTEARAMLRRLSGRTHTVHTGLALRWRERNLALDRVTTSEVTFRTLLEETIERYLSLVPTLDKAGGYGIQDRPELIIARQTGSLSNIIGLPLETTKHLLTEAGLLR